MKNYIAKWYLTNLGYAEAPEMDYTEEDIENKEFIDSMSVIIKDAKCGWDGVRFEVMKNKNNIDDRREYMVLYCKSGERWIPISGNSKGCNFSVLGENLW